MKINVLAVVVVEAVPTAGGSALAAVSKGSIGGDQFRRPQAELAQCGKVAGGMDGLSGQGGKHGIDPGAH
jgi:hypothetical protein